VPPASGAAISGAYSLGNFTLTITSPHSVWATGDAIGTQAVLSVNGVNGPVTLSGSGNGPVVFGLEQLDGTSKIDGIWSADCRLGGYSVAAGHPLQYEFSKSGGFDPKGPDGTFWRDFFADPQLHLPPGTWRLTAYASFSVGHTCTASPTSLSASIDITVVD